MKAECCAERRMGGTAGWLVPAAILAVLPKCPMCLVVYFAMLTGLGLSVAAATRIRVLLIWMCAASLACLAAKQFRLWREAKVTTRRKSRRSLFPSRLGSVGEKDAYLRRSGHRMLPFPSRSVMTQIGFKRKAQSQ